MWHTITHTLLQAPSQGPGAQQEAGEAAGARPDASAAAAAGGGGTRRSARARKPVAATVASSSNSDSSGADSGAAAGTDSDATVDSKSAEEEADDADADDDVSADEGGSADEGSEISAVGGTGGGGGEEEEVEEVRPAPRRRRKVQPQGLRWVKDPGAPGSRAKQVQKVNAGGWDRVRNGKLPEGVPLATRGVPDVEGRPGGAFSVTARNNVSWDETDCFDLCKRPALLRPVVYRVWFVGLPGVQPRTEVDGLQGEAGEGRPTGTRRRAACQYARPARRRPRRGLRGRAGAVEQDHHGHCRRRHPGSMPRPLPLRCRFHTLVSHLVASMPMTAACVVDTSSSATLVPCIPSASIPCVGVTSSSLSSTPERRAAPCCACCVGVPRDGNCSALAMIRRVAIVCAHACGPLRSSVPRGEPL